MQAGGVTFVQTVTQVGVYLQYSGLVDNWCCDGVVRCQTGFLRSLGDSGREAGWLNQRGIAYPSISDMKEYN